MLRMTSSPRGSERGLAAAEPDEFQGHADASGGQGLPDLAEAPLTQLPDQDVTRDGLDAGTQAERRGGLRRQRTRLGTTHAGLLQQGHSGGGGDAVPEIVAIGGVHRERIHGACPMSL